MLNCLTKNEFKRQSLSGKISCKRTKKTDWSLKFWDRKFFYYGRVKVVFPRQSKNDLILTHKSLQTIVLHPPQKRFTLPYCYLKWDITLKPKN